MLLHDPDLVFVARFPDLESRFYDLLAELAVADNNLGAIAFANGQTAEAETHFRAGLQATQVLIDLQPEDELQVRFLS